jgi:hypothetical protein
MHKVQQTERHEADDGSHRRALAFTGFDEIIV